MFTFTRARRLLTAGDYQFVFGGATRLSVPGITLLYRKNDLGCSRLGLIVAKKQVKLANKRNRFKRLSRESFRKQEALQSIPVDIVILVYKPLLDCSQPDINAKLDQLWKKLSDRYKASSSAS